VGFLTKYSGTDVVDMGDGYQVTLKRYLSGDALDRAQAARVKAVTEAQQGGPSANRTVRVETITDTAAYTEVLLSEAIVTWNLTDHNDQLLPLEPLAKKLESIRMLPASARARLRDHIEANTEDSVRSEEDQRTFHEPGAIGA